MYLLPSVIFTLLDHRLVLSLSLQYAANLEELAFPDTNLIVKVAKRSLYRTN